MRTFFVCIVTAMLLFTIPRIANAAVFINEVAWMGTGLSASDEWIELYNDGAEAVSLAGWKLLAEDGAPSVSLVGEISAGGFYLLERTDDTSVPDQPADKIYTGDLANTGETLKLLDADTTLIDSVVGGASWESVGGNNTTKDTPQRQTDGTWITGVPTPKTINTTTASEVGTVAGASTSTPSAVVKKKAVTGGYKQVVFAYAGEDTTAFVGADARFEGYAVSDSNARVGSASYVWSFGDGAKEKGKEQVHAYHEPGTYVVVLAVSGNYQKHKDKMIVTVVPADVRVASVTHGARGYIEISNQSPREIDLSRWHLAVTRARGHKKSAVFTMPDDTIIAGATSVRFPNRVTKLETFPDDSVTLQLPSGTTFEPFVESVASTTTSTEAVES